MSEHELEKLLGGFAADTLTSEEKQRLYSAALQDQQLFNALADEQALKELLADPVVRRRLLQSLQETSTPGAGGRLTWHDWFRRPAGLAWAGGLTVAIFAIVLGTKIYQDSLKQAAQPVATEETELGVPSAPAPAVSPPAPPSIADPEQKAKENVAPAKQKQMVKKDALLDNMAKREEPTIPPSSPQEQQTFESAGAHMKQRSDQDDARRQSGAPVTTLGKAPEERIASAHGKLAAGTAPPAAPAPTPMPAPAIAPIAGAVAPVPSARALFYRTGSEPAAEQEQLSQMAAAEESGAATGRTAESPLKEKRRAERSTGLLGKLERPKPSPERPLGLRYSLIMAGPGGIDLEVDPATRVGLDDAPRLAVQTNEDGYLSVLHSRPSSDQPTVLFPSSGDGRVVGRKPVAIALANVYGAQQTADQIRLLIIFSRTPIDVNRARPTEGSVPRLLIEQVDPSQPGAPAEQAVYVVNLDPAPASSLSTEILLSLRP
ncbi:MAG: hypothetical protein ACT4OL_10860 [Nitrospiraceae bacterium]